MSTLPQKEARFDVPSRHEERIVFVKQSLDHLENLSFAMVSKLESFQDRLSHLEKRVSSVHEKTQRMTKNRDNLDLVLRSFDRITQEFEVMSEVESVLARGPETSVTDFISALDRLYSAMDFFSGNTEFAAAERTLSQLRGALHRALRKEDSYIERVLKRFGKPVHLRGLDPTRPVEFFPPEVVEELRILFERLLVHDQRSCLATYGEHRGSFLAESLNLLQADLLSEDDEEVVSSTLHGGMEQVQSHPFTQFALLLVMLLKSEKQAVEHILRRGEPSDVDAMYKSIPGPAIFVFIRAGESLVRRARTQENYGIFVLLTVATTTESLVSEVGDIVSDSDLVQKILEFCTIAKSSARRALLDVQENVRSHAAKSITKDGTVHELTSNTLSLLKHLLEFQDIVDSLLPPSADAKLSAIGRFTLNVLADLRQNLELKAKTKGGSLGSIFMLNNFAFITKAIEASEIALFIGKSERDNLHQLINRLVDEYLDNWAVAGACLLEKQQMKKLKSSEEKSATKAKFSKFNSEFEDLYRSQKMFVIPDGELVDKIRDRIEEMIVPLYSELYSRYTRAGGGVDFCKHVSKYVHYDVDTLQAMLRNLFEKQLE